MKWIGQHIVDFIARFRSDVYLEGITTSTETDMLVVDANNKVSKRAIDAITVDVSDFMTNGANNRILTATGTDAINAEASLTYDGAGGLDLTSATSAKPVFTISNTNTDAVAPEFIFNKDITGTDGDDLGKVKFLGRDASSNPSQTFAQILAEIGDATHGSEAGLLSLSVAQYDGSLVKGLSISGASDTDGDVNTVLGHGVTSLCEVAGNMLVTGGTLTSGGSWEIATGVGGYINLAAEGVNVTSTGTLAPTMKLKSTSNNAYGGYIILQKDRGDVPADNDAIGTVFFQAEDSGQTNTTYGSIEGTIIETDHGDEAGQIAITVANDGVLRNGITVKGDKGTATEVDVDIANGAASTTTIAGTLTMGSTAAMTNAGLVSVAGQTNITSLGTLTALDVDNININGDTITASGDLNLVATGNDINVDTDFFTIESASNHNPYFTLKSTFNGVDGANIKFLKDRGAAAVNDDIIGAIIFSGQNDAEQDTTYGKIEVQALEVDDTDEAGRMTFKVAESDGTSSNQTAGLVIEGSDNATDGEVNVTIAAGAASVTTVAGTLTMGSTAALTNAGLVAVANQSNITGVGTISSGVWEGTTIKTAYIGDDQVTEDKLANTLLAEIDANTAKVTNSDQSQADINGLAITTVGTITSGEWQGAAIASGHLDADTAHLSGAQSFTGLKTFSAGIIPSFVKHSISGNSAGDYGPGAEILFGISAETTTAGVIYVLRGGVWVLMDADDADKCRQLAAVAVGTNSATNGMLIKGCVTLAADYTAGTDGEGTRVFASTTAGEATLTAPTASGDTVRVLGYSLNVSDQKMFFNPDNTHVEIA